MAVSPRLVGCPNSPLMPSKDNASAEKQSAPAQATGSALLSWALKLVAWAVGLAAAGLASILLVVSVAMVIAYPNLPDISDLADYKPKLPLRVFT